MNEDSPIQDSSTFKIRLDSDSNSNILSAYYYLNTRQRSELLWIGTVLVALYPRPRSYLSTERTSESLTFKSVSRLTMAAIMPALAMGTPEFSSFSAAASIPFLVLFFWTSKS